MANTTKKSVKVNKEEKNDTVSKKEYEALLKKFEEMQEALTRVTNNNQPIQNITQYIGDKDKDISVTSLTVGLLNLSTEGYGAGEVYKFRNIGEEQMIPMEDLKKIVKNNKSFIEGGKVFINDDEVVKNLKLTNAYKKLLSYNEINDLFSKDRKAFEKIFSNMTANQKETVKRIIFEKLSKDAQSVDMNIVQVVNNLLDVDIMSDVRKQQELLEYIKNDN